MNKAELITKKDTELALNTFWKVIEKTLVSGNKVQLVGFGTFEVRRWCHAAHFSRKT